MSTNVSVQATPLWWRYVTCQLQLHPASSWLFMGPSGSGKSTVLNMADRLDDPTDGSVWVGGVDLTSLDPHELAELRRKRVGYVFQTLNLVAALTMVESVVLRLELDGMKVRAARPTAVEALREDGDHHPRSGAGLTRRID